MKHDPASHGFGAVKAMWAGLWAMALKEAMHTAREKNKLRRMATVQFVTLIMMAFLDTSVRNLPTVIVDHDQTAESRELVAKVRAAQTFDIKYSTTSTEQARDHIRAGRAKVAIIIPPDYGRARTSGTEADVLALVDGSDAAASSQAIASLEGVAAHINIDAETVDEAEARGLSSIDAHIEFLYNPDRRVGNFMLPGALAVILGLAYLRNSAIGIASERQGGNLERLLMTPVSFTAVILGKMFPWFILGIFNAVLYLILINVGLGVPIRGSHLLLMGCVLLYLLCILSLGAFIGAKASNAGEVGNSVAYITVAIFFLSGYILPLSSVPKVLLPIAYAIPHTHFIEVMRGVCLRGAGANELGPHLVYLLVAPIVFTIGAVRRFANAVMD